MCMVRVVLGWMVQEQALAVVEEASDGMNDDVHGEWDSRDSQAGISRKL